MFSKSKESNPVAKELTKKAEVNDITGLLMGIDTEVLPMQDEADFMSEELAVKLLKKLTQPLPRI